MDRLPEVLMAFAALMTAICALVVSVWQQYRIDRAERWAREARKGVERIDNGTSPPTPPHV